jgi:Mg2+-importing ATPase
MVLDLNREGHIVGFLGDVINNTPALRAADAGISVDTAAGIAKEAADIILLKKSLLVLAHGIIAGRKTFGNITKYILNTISTNYGNMITVAMSSLFLKFIPLLPSQILLNNFITDAPFLTISTDNVDREFLKRPKR